MTGVIRLGGKNPDAWLAELEAWAQLGVSQVAVNTAGHAWASPQAHIDALERFKALSG